MIEFEWDYAGKEARPYDDEQAYEIGMDLLIGCDIIEDWGCGYAWAKRYCPGIYVGVDWAPGFADVVADLRHYRSEADGIFMRGVLEHNDDWPLILDNALASTPHLVLVLFTPMSPATYLMRSGLDIAFAAIDIESRFGLRPFTFDDYRTDTQYGTERIYDVHA